MKQFRQNLSNHTRSNFSIFQRKYVLNEIIEDKDFSEYYFKHVKFFNCIFKRVSFSAAECYRLSFYNCQFYEISFRKTELTKIIFRNSQFFNCRFGSADFYLVRYVNCQLNNLWFNATNLVDFEIDKSKLVHVSFGGSEVENFTIQNSILKDIDCGYMKLSKNISLNGEVKTITLPINDYESFLREFVDNTSLVSDFEVLKSILLVFSTITSFAYCLLKPPLFNFLTNHFL
jgi:uncharacterized protein YjbI with pentapeptide repeats